MGSVIQLNLLQFLMVYLLLLIVLFIMKKAKIHQTKLLFWAGFRMSLQLALAGFVLTWIFQRPHPLFTVVYILSMIGFSAHRTLSKRPELSRRFRLIVVGSLGISGLSIIVFFVGAVVGVGIFNPQYTIPISGMIMGNALTGITLGLKTFFENIKSNRFQIEALLNVGVHPAEALMPFVNQATETAILPTLNSMVGMGIISLPGMMTGQILSGTLPMTAILYQISIMIAICTAVCLSVFCSLYFGHKTLYNKRNQMIWP